jgi:hypothetical protein
MNRCSNADAATGQLLLDDRHVPMKKKLALALCLAALATRVAARPMEDYQCGKAKTHILMAIEKNWVQKRDKKTGEMVAVRVPPFARCYLVLDYNEKEIKPPPSRLLRIKGDDLYYRGEKCAMVYPDADGNLVPIDQIQPYKAVYPPPPPGGYECIKPDGTPEPCELRRAQ